MLKKMFSIALSAVLLAGCASALSGEYARGSGKTLPINKTVWSGWQEYMTKIQGTNNGAFVVAVLDGVGVDFTYRYCPGTSCFTRRDMSNHAMEQCAGHGYDCILFAHSSYILVDYKLLDE
jgi:opacity protein-like surface antigen